MANLDIKEMAKQSSVRLWQIADVLGMTDGNFSKKLRKELADEEKQKIFKIIEDLKNNNTAA